MVMEYIIGIPVGILLGIASGLGLGGGSLLVLWLNFYMKMEQTDIRMVNLLFFIPCALISTMIYRKNSLLPWKKLILGTIAGCIASAAFSWISGNIQLEILKSLFGVLLIVAGIQQLLYREKK